MQEVPLIRIKPILVLHLLLKQEMLFSFDKNEEDLLLYVCQKKEWIISQ